MLLQYFWERATVVEFVFSVVCKFREKTFCRFMRATNVYIKIKKLKIKVRCIFLINSHNNTLNFNVMPYMSEKQKKGL